jgi:hypothetical protein
MPPIVPPKVPSITRDETVAFLAAAGLPAVDRALLSGRRGYFANFGASGNDFGVYDDGMVLTSPTAFVTYNANTDPSVKKPKVAVLQPGRRGDRVSAGNGSDSGRDTLRVGIVSGRRTTPIAASRL